MLRAMCRAFFSLALICAASIVDAAAASSVHAQDTDPTDASGVRSRRSRPASERPPSPPPEPEPAAEPEPASAPPDPPAAVPEPVPIEPPPAVEDADQAAAAPPQDPNAPPPPPATEGDYAGTGGVRESDDALASDTAEEPDAHYSDGELREFSVRLDPLNWLLLGRLGVELELGVWEFISVELIPVFVTASEPLLLNYSRLDNTLTQESRGIGPISGASLGVGFWLFGEPFSGYVIRLNITNYAYTYRASDDDGVFDRVEFTERRVAAFFGSHSRFGPFTFAGGFGLGFELNQSERCGLTRVSDGGETRIRGRDSNCEDRQLIALDRTLGEVADLNGPLHPVYFEARFSLGLVF